jgi:cytoskeleton protein RodZ
MENFGLELRQARESRGVSLRDIATRTKISARALEALERNDFSQLPGGIFGRAFVRAYALEIGVDPDATVASFVELLERSEAEAAARGAVRPEITDDDREFLARQHRAVVGLRVAVVAFIVLVIVVGTWQVRAYMRRHAALAADSAAAASSASTNAPVPVVATPPSATAGAVTPTGDRLVLELDLSGDCWISVGVDGKSPMAQLYRPGDHPRIEAEHEVVLDVGNAGAVRMTINGKAAKPLGRDGIPVRTRLTRDNFAELLQ